MPPADFKPANRLLLVFLNSVGRGGLGFASFFSCDFVRKGARSGLQCSQVPSLQHRPSEHYQASTVHLCQAGTFNPPHCVSVRCTD